MLYKIALSDPTPLETISDGLGGLVKTASGRVLIEPGSEKEQIVQAEIKKHPNALFFRAKAIKADEPNSNGDSFSTEELLKSYKSFEGVPFFTNHENQDVEKAKGKIIFAEWDKKENACYTISFVDRDAYPHICRGIEEGYMTGVSMGAICGGSMIRMADGSEKIIEEVISGDQVVSHNGNVNEVNAVHSEFLGKDMYSFDLTTYHKAPTFTNDHPIYAINNDEIVCAKNEAIKTARKNKHERSQGTTADFIGQDTWRTKKYNPSFKEAEKVSKGDYFLVPSKFQLSEGGCVNTELFYLMGAYLGDGYLKRDKKGELEAIAFCLGSHEFALADKITKLFQTYSKSKVNSNLIESRNGLYLTVYDRHLANYFYDRFGTGSKNKRIKLDIDKIEDAKNLIAGYLDTDGCIVDKTNQDSRGNKFGGFQISSANIGLLEDVQSLLIALGTISRISTFDRTPSINSVVNVPTVEHTLAIGSNASNIFDKSIKYSSSKFETAEIKAGKSFIYTDNDLNYMACPVKSVSTVEYDEPVYDLTVANDESYIADGIAIHNCSVEYSVCSICSNKAERTEDYCTHIRNRKGRNFNGTARDVVSGENKKYKDALVFEHNYGLKFIELSAVVDPACPSCHIEGIIPNDDYLKRVASFENELRFVKTAAMEKNASQEEIDQINQVLETMENIAVNLIQNREQVEVEFASDLVEIMSSLQEWLGELVGAGYGNLQTNAVPGTLEGEAEQGMGMEMAPAEGQPPAGQPAAGVSPTPVASEQVGAVAGQPGKPLVNTPQMPITSPMMPNASSDDSIRKTADEVVPLGTRLDIGNTVLQKAANLNVRINKTGEIDMAKRRTVANKKQQIENTKNVLSQSWQEKMNFFEYIKEVPSLQDNQNRLSVKKRDDSFIIVAESRDQEDPNIQIWTYENLSEDDKDLIKQTPRMAAAKLLGIFSNNTNSTIKGVEGMSKKTTEAGANTVLSTPEVITEKQLADNASQSYHGRTGDDKHEITQKQLESARADSEPEVLTEKQLDDADLKLNPRQGDGPEVITQKQLDTTDGVSPRKDEDLHTITQDQLESDYRTGNEPEVITEKQLDTTDAPWARQSSRDASLFKSASEHMSVVTTAFAETAIETGATPEEVQELARELVAGTQARYKFAGSLLEPAEDVQSTPFNKRVAYWNSKNVKVATASPAEVENTLTNKLRSIAADTTINPEVVIDAVDVLSDGEIGAESISKQVDSQLSEASSDDAAPQVSVKDALREALQVSVQPQETEKETRDEEREEILASLKGLNQKTANEDHILNRDSLGVADTVIETSFEELGVESKNDPAFRKTVAGFTKGALTANGMKLASITNVTIDGDTIQIAVQTDAGEESVEIPIGDDMAPMDDEIVPEGDLSGEGLEGGLAPEVPMEAPMEAGYYASSSKAMSREAQVGGGGGGMQGGQGAGMATGDPAEGGMDGPLPDGGALQSLTNDDGGEFDDEIPTVGEKQMPWSICPECGSADVDVTKEDDGGIIGNCNGCGAAYEALVKKTVEFNIIKPTKSVGDEGMEGPEDVEMPEEVPALPVAAQTRLDQGTIIRIAKNKDQHGEVCPACGNCNCLVTASTEGHTDCSCNACGTGFSKDILVNASNPADSVLRVQWQVLPDTNCPECREEALKFASRVRVNKLLKSASANSDKFPMANCMERIARTYGGNSVAMFGPCKDKPMAECVCNELQRLGFTKVRQMNKLAEASMQNDPMDECIEDQKKRGHDVVEAKSICGCIKNKFASENSDNIYAHAFGEEVEEGKVELTKLDLVTLNETFVEEEATVQKEAQAVLDSEEIGDSLPALDSIEVDVDIVEAAGKCDTCDEYFFACKCKKDGKDDDKDDKSDDDDDDKDDKSDDDDDDKDKEASTDDEVVEASTDALDSVEDGASDEVAIATPKGENNMELDVKALSEALAMDSSRVRRSGEESSIRLAGKPKEIETIEKNVEAGVPRSNATIRNEGSDNIDVAMAKPKVPRATATMGHEGADNINVPAGLPDVAVDSSYMGNEKECQQGMPAINNEIKGTVIADTNKTTKEAKQMKEIDTVEKNVDAGVPRSNATMGHEGKDNIDVTLNTPDVPRSNATMGHEGADNIDVPATGPDVPVDSAYMGVEKEVQKDMPAINSEMLKQVQQKRDEQIEKIASARREEARTTAAWLSSNQRIASDRETFDAVVKALETFEVDKIASTAEKMFPAKAIKTSSTAPTQTRTAGTGLPAIVLESVAPVNQSTSLADRLTSAFTIGAKQLDNALIEKGEK